MGTTMEPTVSMTLKGIPESLLSRLREEADRERRSLNQQAILLLERALERPTRSFGELFDEFVERHGVPGFGDEELGSLRGAAEPN